MISRRHNKNFTFFIANSLCMLSASRLTLFATSWWVVKETGNATGLAHLMAFALLIEVACRFLFANVGEIFNKKHVVMLISLAMGLSSFALYWMLSPSVDFMLALIPIILLSICNAIRMSVNASLLRFIVPDSFLSRAISLNQSVNTFGTMVVPILSGGLIALLGVKLVLIVSILMSVFSIVFLKSINYQQEQEPRQAPREVKAKSLIAMHRESWASFLKISPEVTFAFVCALLNGMMYTFFSVFVPFFASTVTTDGAWIMGALDGAFSIGLFIGATFAIGMLKYHPMSRLIFGFIGVSMAFSLVAIVVFYHRQFSGTKEVVFSMSIPLVIGGASLFYISNSISIIRMKASPKASLSSIMAFSSFISGTLVPFGLFFGGQIIDSMGMEAFCAGTAAIMSVSTLILVFNPHTSAIAKLKESEITDFYIRRYFNP